MGFSLTKWMGKYDPFSSKGNTSQRVLGGLALATAGTLAYDKFFKNSNKTSSLTNVNGTKQTNIAIKPTNVNSIKPLSLSDQFTASQIKLNLAQANRIDPTYGALAQGAGTLLGSLYSTDAQSNIAKKQNELAKEQMKKADELEDEARKQEEEKEKKKIEYYNQMRYSLSGSGLGYI